MIEMSLRTFKLWVKNRNISFDYEPYDAKKFDEITSIELDLENVEVKEIPTLVGDFSNLKSLSISDSKIEEFPQWIGELENLEYLKLSFLGLKELPSMLRGFFRLKELDISGNNIEEIPYWLGKLDIKKLNCSGNDLYTFPTSLASIIELDCSFNQLEGFRTYSNNFPNLMKFNCEQTSISSEIKFEIELDIEKRKDLINKEKKEWLKVLKINSIKAYKEYLVEFPTGKNRKDVVEKLGQKLNKMNKSKKS